MHSHYLNTTNNACIKIYNFHTCREIKQFFIISNIKLHLNFGLQSTGLICIPLTCFYPIASKHIWPNSVECKYRFNVKVLLTMISYIVVPWQALWYMSLSILPWNSCPPQTLEPRWPLPTMNSKYTILWPQANIGFSNMNYIPCHVLKWKIIKSLTKRDT